MVILGTEPKINSIDYGSSPSKGGNKKTFPVRMRLHFNGSSKGYDDY